MNDIKYIRTSNDVIIVFSAMLQHSKFSSFEPKSAGFISFGIDENGYNTCSCYGHSVGLGIASRPEEDTALAKWQLKMNND